mmetsp:Transcript_4296/g.4454  ORF Transcript_4296/g.4454 Transcript_4296/m.4454 type:complete len:185 (+) Transcript_4296:125-679(+)|eukprot:CAMPEP_0119034678 /NCGR_PEP_ID=MMETSP1177-20130426/1691_1 /TAXON_ID=2985 /ORGANISM="Ochromonas sp, Strain CCMP1899" /LENGTH=184 /DNA_ID=CAMNT_0006992295 /DNA_START=85 /DNA_END=639 /DNA_ORIENTATION=+
MMNDDEEQPAWISNTPSSGSEPLNQAAAGSIKSGAGGQGDVAPKYKGCVKTFFLIINLGLMVMMSATGALGIGTSKSISDTSTVIIGLYMVLFAAMSGIFEIIQIYPCSMIDNIYKKNFGFLYGVIGKSGFTVFMAVLSFGLSSPQQLALATGLLGGGWGVIQYLLYMKFPEYFDKKEKFTVQR